MLVYVWRSLAVGGKEQSVRSEPDARSTATRQRFDSRAEPVRSETGDHEPLAARCAERADSLRAGPGSVLKDGLFLLEFIFPSFESSK